MPDTPSPSDLVGAMRGIVTLARAPVPDDRLEETLPSMKMYLASIESLSRVVLPPEAEPAQAFSPDRSTPAAAPARKP